MIILIITGFLLKSCVVLEEWFLQMMDLKKINTKEKPLDRGREALIKLGKLNDVGCLQAFWTFSDFKLYGLTLIQGFKTIILNGRKMNEEVFSAFLRNETKAFTGIEPFYVTFRHNNFSPFILLFALLQFV